MSEKKPLPELTVKAVLLGIILAVIMAAANAYLGLFAGMTVCASIPAAVISMGVLSLFKRSNILENNLVQTAASAGESLAAGVIFTVPALVLMGYWKEFEFFEIVKIAGLGGIIGVLFTIPLRRALIVEAGLKYPEGIATAEVLRVGEEARNGDSKEGRDGLMLLMFSALAGGGMKLCQQAFGMWHSAIEGARVLGGALFGFGMDISPALVSVGYIVGRNISLLVFLGGAISWLIAIPLYSFIIGEPVSSMDAAYEIWNAKIRYLGVGAMVVGGIYSIFQLIKPLIMGVKASFAAYSGVSVKRTERDLPIKWVLIALGFATLPLFLFYIEIINSVGVAMLLTVVMLIFGFLFSAVAGYMAGLVGSSNNPISGITIATILFTSLLLLAILGAGSVEGAAGAIIIGAVICCAAAIAGDNMQDLKAGYILGATPWKQQVMQIIGTIASALTIPAILTVLHSAYTIGSETLSAPQAMLMASVAEGVFNGNLPWNFVGFGALIGVLILIIDQIQKKRNSNFRVPILAVAVGIYLPITLSVPIFLGGMIAHYAKKRNDSKKAERKGLLFASGLITGEALTGILVAIPIFFTGNKLWWPTMKLVSWFGIIPFIAIILWFYHILSKKEL